MEEMGKTPGASKEVDEISLKELILKIQGCWKYAWSKWKVISFFCLLGAAIGIAIAFIVRPKFEASVTFVVEDNNSNPLSAYMGLASQFGFDLGGGSNGIFQGDNVLEFLKSRVMLERTLLAPVRIKGEDISLAELYIDFNNLRNKWKDDSTLLAIKYPLGLNRSKFSLLQDSLLNIIQADILKKNLDIDKPDKKLSFIRVRCTAANEMFAKVFAERLVKEATDFYINTKIQRTKSNVDRLQEQADSLKILLDRKTFSVAASQDMNVNPARQIAGVNTELIMRDKLVLQTMYGEVVKNLELSKIAMSQETPVIQLVDGPILPLEKVKIGKLKALIIGGFLGVLITILCLIVRKMYNEIMS
ncbi:Wzz/FepE/Etk N-terminal domain-containing protein [Chitinophaga defluvii]|uniref:Wzz/FepE/Etk N-terminal domain-containing protein n=1 Tax=Chitinophaga defluvii TaxID=3163343 RepID=A0ABV2T6X1_9BACT